MKKKERHDLGKGSIVRRVYRVQQARNHWEFCKVESKRAEYRIFEKMERLKELDSAVRMLQKEAALIKSEIMPLSEDHLQWVDKVLAAQDLHKWVYGEVSQEYDQNPHKFRKRKTVES